MRPERQTADFADFTDSESVNLCHLRNLRFKFPRFNGSD